MLSSDVIILPAEGAANRWIVYNVFTRTALGIDSQAFPLLADTPVTSPETVPVWQAGWFAHEDGTMADPTRFRRNPAHWGEPQIVNHREFLKECRKQWLIIEDEEDYRRRFSRKKTALDFKNFGNFHDQMGSHLILNKRTSPSHWWLSQKFNPDLKSVREDNLYGKVQTPFLKSYYQRRFEQGATILDVGCGIGFYTNLMAARGNTVLGIDPNPEYIEIARTQALPGTRYDVMSIGQPGGLDAIEEKFDYLFVQDTLLFYFVKINPQDTQDLSLLLKDFLRLLKPGGTLISVEPHPNYYLTPWLGQALHPFTIITEHRHRTFSTVPDQATFVSAIVGQGFALTHMEDLYPSATILERDALFAREFPTWTLFEFIKRNHEKT